MKTRLIAIAAVGFLAYQVLNRTTSDMRYPILLITSLPKMVFRYFV